MELDLRIIFIVGAKLSQACKMKFVVKTSTQLKALSKVKPAPAQ